jgi:hypothetical protein
MLRKFVVVCIAVAACSIVVSAEAKPQAQVTLSSSALKVLFGHELTLSGRLVGGGPGERVSIEAVPYGHPAPIQMASVPTNSSGHFSFKVKPTIQTTYEARSATSASVSITVGVTPATSIRELGNGNIWARVKAGTSFNRRFVELQTKMGGSWSTVAKKRLSTASVAVFSKRLATSSVRVAMSVNEAGVGYLATSSHALAYKAYGLTIDAAGSRVLYGHRLMLSGRLMNGRAGQTISIEAWPYGRSAPVEIASVKTTANGHWSLAVKPTIQTAYRARAAATLASARFVVGVQPVVAISELGNGNIWAHVGAGRSLAGKKVKLQQLTAGTWQTVAQRPLGAKSGTVFSVTLPSSPIRIAMSVNEAGVGLLGTASHTLAYRAV